MAPGKDSEKEKSVVIMTIEIERREKGKPNIEKKGIKKTKYKQ